MKRPSLPADEVIRRGKDWYERLIRPQLGEGHDGEIVVIDVDTGDYEIDRDHLAASRRARAKNPNAVLYGTRIGYPALGRVGGGWGGVRS